MFSLKSRVVTVAAAAITCAVASVGPAASASAATPRLLPCSVNQGLFPFFINLGPTGPLGPLGAFGPLGGTSHLPCGAAVFNFGPFGPLGPFGALGPGAP
jgi:hypothetical protein